MKKHFILAIILIGSGLFSYSQLRLAIAGGGHSSNIIETNDLPNWSEMKNNYSSRGGVHFGFIADLQLGLQSKFYFQPGVMYYNKGRKFHNTYDTTVYNYYSIDRKQYINYIDVPLNVVYKMPLSGKTKFFIGGGPYLSFFYNGFEKTDTYLKSGSVTTDENHDLPIGNGPGKYKTLDIGLSGTAGIEFKGLFIAGNYSHGLSNMYTANYDGSFKNQVVGATLGIFIGKPISLENKPKDTDMDGIPDVDDLCVNDPGPQITKGCPDTDGDGIADREDRCPTEKGPASNFGCPLPTDTDGDGIMDDVDKCKDVPGVAKYQGCPVPDTDGDGINDDEDKCPTVPGLGRYQGCPIPDTDGDGVNDEEDKCVTEPGKKENHGCPEIQKEIIQKVEFAARKVQFDFGKAVLLEESKKVLDEVSDILAKQPELLLDIEGHTSSDGSLKANMSLSAERAETVKAYLVEKGINADRLSAQGYGPTRPLNEGKTAQERALNRRVELKLRNN